MAVVAIYGSPREGGNTDIILDSIVEPIQRRGRPITRLYLRRLSLRPCRGCDGCQETGSCVIEDDMTGIYPILEGARTILVGTPIYFYGPTAQLKILIDRCQALWHRRRAEGAATTTPSRAGYLIAVGATSGKQLFTGARLTVKYFLNALAMRYEDGLLIRGVEQRGAISRHPAILSKARQLGQRCALSPEDGADPPPLQNRTFDIKRNQDG